MTSSIQALRLNILILFVILGFSAQLSSQTVITISFDDPSTVPTSCNTIFTEEGVPQQLVNNSGSCFFDYQGNGELWLFPATLSVDLSGLGSIEKVEVDINDFCGTGCSQAMLLDNGNTILSTSNMTGSPETLVLDNSNLADVDELTISSFEGLFFEIRIFVEDVIAPCTGTTTVISFNDPSSVPTSCLTPFTEEGVEQQLTDNGGNCSFDYSTMNNGELWLFPATLSVDLSGLGTITSIEVDHTDFCGIGCSQATLLSSGNTVLNTANTMSGSLEVLLLDNTAMASVDELTISSFEGLFFEIRICAEPVIDPCAGTGDSDNDSVCDALDVCPGFDDTIDRDGNGIPDYCDFCDFDRTLMEASEAGDNLVYAAINTITSGQLIKAGADVTFSAGFEVDLIAGFEVEPNAVFHAVIEGCVLPTRTKGS